MQYTALAPDLGQVFKQQHQITRVETAFMNRLALSPVAKSACQSLMVPSPVPRPTGTTLDQLISLE